jgi:hypothetical protein
MLSECTRIFPVAEAIRVVLRIAADHGNESKREEHAEEENLSEGEPKLALSVPFDNEGIDAEIEHNACCHDGFNGDVVTPEGQDKVQCGDLKGNQNGFVDEEVCNRLVSPIIRQDGGKEGLTPTDHEAQSLVDPFARHANEATSDRHVGAHFGLAVVDQTQHAGVDGVSEKERAGTTLD